MIGERVKITERTVFTIVDALSAIGGFSGSVFIACSFLVSWYSQYCYYCNIVAQTYKAY